MIRISDRDFDLIVSSLPQISLSIMRNACDLKTYNRARRLLMMAQRLQRKRHTRPYDCGPNKKR